MLLQTCYICGMPINYIRMSSQTDTLLEEVRLFNIEGKEIVNQKNFQSYSINNNTFSNGLHVLLFRLDSHIIYKKTPIH